MQDVMNNPPAAVSTDGKQIFSTPKQPSASQDALQRYLSDIGQFPLLDRKQQIALAKQTLAKNKQAKDQLIHCNLRLVVKIAKEYQNRGVPLLDLIDEGNLGLIHATTKFKPDLGYAFTTYACYWIRHRIERAVIEQSKVVRLPINKHKDLNRYLHLAYQFQHRHGYWPKPEEITELSSKEQKNFSFLLQYHQDSLSLDKPLTEDSTQSFVDTLVVEETPCNYESKIDKDTTFSFLRAALKQLSPLQKNIIERRFGLAGHAVCTLAELAKDCGVSPERVRQIQIQALSLLRKLFEDNGLSLDAISLPE